MTKRTPTSHRQAIGALIENIGGAISTYGSHIFGLDPVAPEQLETPPETDVPAELDAAPETEVERDPDKPYQPLIGDAQPDRIPTVPEQPKKPRKPSVKMTRSEWRKAFIEAPQPFTLKDIKEATNASDNTIIRKMELFDEVVKAEPSVKNPGRGGWTPAKYKFDSSINPAVPEPEPEPEEPALSGAQEAAEAEGIHPLRVGADKPKVSNKDIQALIDRAWDAGWHVVRTENGHIKYMSTDRESTVYSASSPSDYRAVKNVQAELERHGLRFDSEQPRERSRLLGLRR